MIPISCETLLPRLTDPLFLLATIFLVGGFTAINRFGRASVRFRLYLRVTLSFLQLQSLSKWVNMSLRNEDSIQRSSS